MQQHSTGPPSKVCTRSMQLQRQESCPPPHAATARDATGSMPVRAASCLMAAAMAPWLSLKQIRQLDTEQLAIHHSASHLAPSACMQACMHACTRSDGSTSAECTQPHQPNTCNCCRRNADLHHPAITAARACGATTSQRQCSSTTPDTMPLQTALLFTPHANTHAHQQAAGQTSRSPLQGPLPENDIKTLQGLAA